MGKVLSKTSSCERAPPPPLPLKNHVKVCPKKNVTWFFPFTLCISRGTDFFRLEAGNSSRYQVLILVYLFAYLLISMIHCWKAALENVMRSRRTTLKVIEVLSY